MANIHVGMSVPLRRASARVIGRSEALPCSIFAATTAARRPFPRISRLFQFSSSLAGRVSSAPPLTPDAFHPEFRQFTEPGPAAPPRRPWPLARIHGARLCRNVRVRVSPPTIVKRFDWTAHNLHAAPM